MAPRVVSDFRAPYQNGREEGGAGADLVSRIRRGSWTLGAQTRNMKREVRLG